jgi:DNA polymerase I-like protein with 3'-5' exonuclease and polymerase domains
VEAGFLDPAVALRTPPSKTFPAGQLRSDEDALKLISDPILAAAFVYRAKLKTCLVTFMENWLAVAERSGGLIFTEWHQTRGSEGGGARTGRLSSSPNFQNLVKQIFLWRDEAPMISDPKDRAEFEKKAPRRPTSLSWLPPLPVVRSYVVPWDGDAVLVDRDYSQQEPRILAHFEGGDLMRQYQADPWIDYHDNAKFHLERVMGRPYARKPVKNINLGIIYGQGVGSLAVKNESTVEETREIRNAILKLYPGLRKMNDEMKRRAQTREPLVTWGGRRCMCEEPAILGGRVVTFEYKMINTLVQGSAGDCTKEALVRFHAVKWQSQEARAYAWAERFCGFLKEATPPEWRIYLTAHDEVLVSAPKRDLFLAMEVLRAAMESVEFDVQILSEGDYGPDWASLKKFDKRGVQVHGLVQD